MGEHALVFTARLEIRLPTESDRPRFVELFGDQHFMAFSGGALSPDAAHRRFDSMLATASELAFAKQPVVERSTGTIVGYAGVDWFDLDGERHLELGYRMVLDARGQGYATEACRAILAIAAETFRGVVFALIDPTNHLSQNVARKLGFTFWKQDVVGGYLDNIYRLHLGEGEIGDGLG